MYDNGGNNLISTINAISHVKIFECQRKGGDCYTLVIYEKPTEQLLELLESFEGIKILSSVKKDRNVYNISIKYDSSLKNMTYSQKFKRKIKDSLNSRNVSKWFSMSVLFIVVVLFIFIFIKLFSLLFFT